MEHSKVIIGDFVDIISGEVNHIFIVSNTYSLDVTYVCYCESFSQQDSSPQEPGHFLPHTKRVLQKFAPPQAGFVTWDPPSKFLGVVKLGNLRVKLWIINYGM